MTTPSNTLTSPQHRHSATSDRVAAWMPAGMLDWPGRVAATLFLTGCQLRCPYCHNATLIAPQENHGEWESFVAYLERRRAWIDGVVVTGGEPTTDPNIERLLEAFAALDLPVKLDTNGMRPDLLGKFLKRGLLSYVALDVKTLPERYAILTALPDAEERIRASIMTLKKSSVDHEFRTTCYPGLVPLDHLPRIAGLLQGGNLYALQQFRSDTTLHAEASRREPHHPTELSNAAALCSEMIPTITRGM